MSNPWTWAVPFLLTLVTVAPAAGQAPDNAQDERHLKDGGVEPTGGELLRLIARQSPKESDAFELKRLIEQLGDDDFAKREKASTALRQMGVPALQALRAAAKDTDREVVLRAGRLVKQIEAESALIPAALRVLLRQGSGDALREVMRSEVVAIRREAMALAQNVKLNDAQREAVMEAFGDEDAAVRSRVDTVLRLSPSDGIKAVLELAKHKNRYFRRAGVYLLSKHNDKPEQALPVLVKALEDKEVCVRRQAASALAAFDDKRTVAALAKALKDPDETDDKAESSVASRAARSLCNMAKNAPIAARILINAADSGPVCVRREVVSSLGNLGRVDEDACRVAIVYLTKALADDDGEVRDFASSALAIMGRNAAPTASAMLKALDAERSKGHKFSYRIRTNLICALGKVGSREAVPEICRELDKGDHIFIRIEAAEALGRIKMNTDTVRATLERAAKSEQGIGMVAVAAKAALRDIAR